MRKNLVSIACKQCQKSFLTRLDQLARGMGQHCSRKCAAMTAAETKRGINLVTLRESILPLLESGMTHRQIGERLGFTKKVIGYHSRKLGLKRPALPKYDWISINKDYASGSSYSELELKYGIARATISKARRLGVLTPYDRPNNTTWLTFAEASELHAGVRTARGIIRDKILAENLIPYVCKLCGISEWQGKPLVLRLDHINGHGGDHKLSNLRFLCPNCDSQQPTFGHRNRGRYADNGVRSSASERPAVTGKVEG